MHNMERDDARQVYMPRLEAEHLLQLGTLGVAKEPEVEAAEIADATTGKLAAFVSVGYGRAWGPG